MLPSIRCKVDYFIRTGTFFPANFQQRKSIRNCKCIWIQNLNLEVMRVPASNLVTFLSKKNRKNQLAMGFEPLSLRHHATRATNTTFLDVKFQFYSLFTVSIHVWDVLVDCKFALLVRNAKRAQWIIDPPGGRQPFEKKIQFYVLQKTAKTSFEWNELFITLQGIPMVRQILPSSEGVAVTDV